MSEQDIQRYSQMLEEDPKSRAFAPLAEAYRKTGKLDEAIETAERGLKHHPGYTGGLVVLGRSLYEKNELERASEILQQATKETPDNYMAQKFLGKVLFDKGEVSEAKKALDFANMLSPDDQEVINLLEEAKKKAAKPKTLDFEDADAAPEVVVPPPPPPKPVTVDGVELEPLGDEFSELGDGQDQALLSADGALPEIVPETELIEAEELQTAEETFEELPPGAAALMQEVEEFQDPVIVPEPAAQVEASPEPAPAPPEEVFIPEPAQPEGFQPVEELQPSPVPGLIPEADPEAAMEAVPEFIPEPAPEPVPAPAPEPVPIPDPEPAPVHEPAPEAAFVPAAEPPPEPPAQDMATETMADIYTQQGELGKAKQIYSHLLAQNPGDEGLRSKLAALESATPPEANKAAAEPPGTGIQTEDTVATLEKWLVNITNLQQERG
jgi:tetratricopeptide (TPR) repeat protein